MPENTPANAGDMIQKFSVPLAIVLAGALIAGALYFSDSSKQPGTGGQPIAVDIKDVDIGPGDPYIGETKAPVTMAYWSDFQCPYCKAVEVGGIPQIPIPPALPTLIKDYVDTGKLRIVFKDFPFLGEDSITAALYEHAIWEAYPAKFYTWRKAMFEAQDDEGDQGFGDEVSIVKLIEKIKGMDVNKLKALITQKNDEYMALISADRDEGASLGINGTPAFIIGKTLISGADQLSTFTALIDAELK